MALMKSFPAISGLAISGALLASALAAAAALAQGSGLIDNFDDWSAFAVNDNNGKACYAASLPIKEEGKYTSRGDTYVMVTHRPTENSFDVVSIRAGYVYKAGSEVEVTIGGQTFLLFTDGGYAFARDAKTDGAMAMAMKKGATMIVRGTSTRGTLTTDTYSLSGATASHQAIAKACGVK